MKRVHSVFKNRKTTYIIFSILLFVFLFAVCKSTYKAHTLEYLYEATEKELQLCLEDKGVLSSWGWYSNDELISRQFNSTGISELGIVTLYEEQELSIEVKSKFGAAKVAMLSPTGEFDLLEPSSETYVAKETGEYRVYSVLKHFWGVIQITPFA